MKKEPMTIHITPLLKYALNEKSEQANFKNVNTYVTDILTKHIKQEQEAEKLFNEISEVRESINDIKEVLALLINK